MLAFDIAKVCIGTKNMFIVSTVQRPTSIIECISVHKKSTGKCNLK